MTTTKPPAQAVRVLPGQRRWTGSRFTTQVWVLTARSVRAAFGDYRVVFFGLMQPVVLLLLFSQVFAGVGSLPGVAQYDGYVNFLMPASLINIAVMTAMGSGAGLIAETYTGVVGRFRTLPISPASVLLARTFADAARLAAQLVVTVLAGIAVLGFRPGGGVAGISAAVGLVLVAGWGLAWVFVAIATWQRSVEAMQAVSFIVMFPLMFSSSAYMPVDLMPRWIQVLSAINPLTYAIDATRALALGRPPGWSVAVALLLTAGIALAGGWVALRNYRRTG